MAENIRIIKKYQNRKLYDTQDSCYVTLDGIAKMLREGEEIAVVDNNTKDDVTALILTQVLYEQEKTNQSVLPVSILKHIIRSGSNNLFEFMQKYIFGAVDAHLKVQEDLRLHVQRLQTKGEINQDESAILMRQIETLAQSNRSLIDQKIEDRLNQRLSSKDQKTDQKPEQAAGHLAAAASTAASGTTASITPN